MEIQTPPSSTDTELTEYLFRQFKIVEDELVSVNGVGIRKKWPNRPRHGKLYFIDEAFYFRNYTETASPVVGDSGVLTLNCDINGNSHDVTILEHTTMGQPIKVLNDDQYVSGAIEIHGWLTHGITWPVEDWDWGLAGEPLEVTDRTLVWYYRKAGDTRTLIALSGAFSAIP